MVKLVKFLLLFVVAADAAAADSAAVIVLCCCNHYKWVSQKIILQKTNRERRICWKKIVFGRATNFKP